MKKILLLSMLLPFAWSCGEKPANDPEPDAGFDICLFVDNPRVGNILAPEFRDELLACGVTLTHNGETYPLEWPETPSAESTGGRGFRVEPYDPGIDETPVLRFGEFPTGGEGCHGEEFTIDWVDGELQSGSPGTGAPLTVEIVK